MNPSVLHTYMLNEEWRGVLHTILSVFLSISFALLTNPPRNTKLDRLISIR